MYDRIIEFVVAQGGHIGFKEVPFSTGNGKIFKLTDVSIFSDGSMRYTIPVGIVFDRMVGNGLSDKLDSVKENILLLIENNKFL